MEIHTHLTSSNPDNAQETWRGAAGVLHGDLHDWKMAYSPWQPTLTIGAQWLQLHCYLPHPAQISIGDNSNLTTPEKGVEDISGNPP